LVSFRGIHDRNAAETLRGLIVHVERDAADVPEDPEEYYDSTLQGLRVELPDGTELGVISDVVHLPGQDLLAVSVHGRDVLIPFIAAFVPHVDPAGGRVVVTPPDGLLELEDEQQ
jgi:16S rRNA processing protein RimM